VTCDEVEERHSISYYLQVSSMESRPHKASTPYGMETREKPALTCLHVYGELNTIRRCSGPDYTEPRSNVVKKWVSKTVIMVRDLHEIV
jgi:hypothetical protein